MQNVNERSSSNFLRGTRGQTNDEMLQVDTDDEESDSPVWKSRPDVWTDDTRMNALFAPFRNRDLNPLHYDAKLKFWKDAIVSYCREKEILQLSLGLLESAFARQGKTPKCLETCLNDLVKEGALQPRDEFLKPKTSGLLYGMFNKLVWTPLAWSTSLLMRKAFLQSPSSPSVNKVSSLAASPSKPPPDLNSSSLSSSPSVSRIASFTSPQRSSSEQVRWLVCTDLIEKKATDLHKLLQDRVLYTNTDCVVEVEALYDLAKTILTQEDRFEEDLDLVTRHLQLQGKMLVDESSIPNRRLVKFSHKLSASVEPLTPIEVSYQDLRSAERRLELEMSTLDSQIESLNAQARECLKQTTAAVNSKNAALRHLKKRKLLEKSYETKEGALGNIQGLVISIQQADTNKMTFDVYNKSIEALKQVNKELDLDKVEDTMCELKDVLDANSEVQEALAKPVEQPSSSAEDADLLKELDELVAESATKAAHSAFDMNKLLDSLPSVPSTNPAAQFKFEKKLDESQH